MSESIGSILNRIQHFSVAELYELAPQLAACLKACELRLALLAQASPIERADELLTPEQVAQYLGVHKSYVYRWKRQIPGYVPSPSGRGYRFSRKALDAAHALAGQGV